MTPTATATATATPTPSPTPTVLANLKITPAKLNFGKVYASASSKVHKVTIVNASKANSTIGLIVPPAAALSSDFTISNNLCSGVTLAPKKKCSFGLAYTPTTPTGVLETRTLTVPHDGGITNMTLSGIPIPVTLAAPKVSSFPLTARGNRSAPKTLTITNNSPVSVTITGKAFSAGNFAIVSGTDLCSGSILDPKASPPVKKCTVQVEFAPQANASPGAVPPETLQYNYAYGHSLAGNAQTVLKGSDK